MPVFSDQNVVTVGSSIQVLPAGSLLSVSLTPVLNAYGAPLLSAGLPVPVVNTGTILVTNGT